MTSYQTPTANPAYNLEEEAWWVQRWIDLLNSYRFQKGVWNGDASTPGKGIFSVLSTRGRRSPPWFRGGTADEPYKLSIWLDAFSDEDWNYVIRIPFLRKRIYSAQLLAGEMPGKY